jgi:uncharacterized repeat protein (TIGR03833 family)
MDTQRHNHTSRNAIHPGITVDIIQKQDQNSGKRTRGIVQEILTSSLSHPHGIKVRLADGRVGRVIEIFRREKTDNTGQEGLAGIPADGARNKNTPVRRSQQ